MADEVIGGVAITISGDFSQLEQDFQQAVSQAQQDGTALASAIQSAVAAPDTGPLKDALSGIGEGASESLAALSQALQGVSGEAEAAGTAISQAFEGVSAPAEALASAVQSAGAEMAALGGDASEASGGVGTLEERIQALVDSGMSLAEALAADETAMSGLADGASTAQGAAEALDQLSTSAGSAAQAEEAVASAFAAANPSVAESGKSAEEASNSFGTLGEKLLGLGEALAITEGLKELGQEALTASDNITHASIALTAITGSAEDAESTIKGLEALGQSDGLSMPSLLTAGTRLQQLLGPEANVASLLSHIADGAAVMGTSIEAAAQKFALLAEGGNASQRAMASLGLNFTQLAAAINEVNPALNATADNAKKLFAAMDPGDRIQVLTAALTTLGGTAQQVAEQTFGGQWQQLANQWEAIMVEVGKALMPVISELTDFAKTDIIPALKGIVDAFQSLSPPVQTLVTVLGVAAAAVVPLTAGLAALGLALEGLSGLGAAVEGTIGALGAVFTTTAAEEDALTVSTVALKTAAGEAAGEEGISAVGAAAAAAEGGVAGLATVIGVTLVGAITAALALTSDFTTRFQQLSDAAKQSDADFQEWIGMTVTAALTSQNWADGTQKAADAQEKVNTALANGLISTKQAVEYTQQLDAAQRSLVGSGWKEQADALGISLHVLADGAKEAASAADIAAAKLAAAAISTQGLRDALTATQQKLVDTVAAFNAGKASAADVAAAFDAVNASTRQLSQYVGEATPKVTELATATHALNDIWNISVTAEEAVANATEANEIKIQALSNALINANKELQNAEAHFTAVEQAVKDGEASYADLEQAMQEVVKWQKAVESEQDALNKAIGQPPPTTGIFSPEVKAQMDALGKSIQDIGGEVVALPPLISPLNQAMIDLGIKSADAGTNVGKLKANLDTLIGTDIPVLVKAFKDGTVGASALETGINDVDKAIANLAKTDLPAATREQGAFVAQLQATGAPVTVIETEMGKYQSMIQKLAKDDLPAAIQADKDLIDQLVKEGATYGQLLDAQAKLAQDEITNATRRGEDATEWVLALEGVRLKQEALKLSTQGLGDAYVGIVKDILSGFDQVGKAIADNIVDAKNWGQVFTDVGKSIAKMILETIIQGALLPLKVELINLIASLLPSTSSALVTVGAGVGALSTSAGTAAQGLTNLAAAANAAASQIQASVGSGGAGGGGLTGAVSHLADTINLITGIIQAGAAIVGDVYLAAIDTKMFHVETSLVEIRNEIQNLRADAWAQHNGLLDKFDAIFNRLGDIWNTLQGGSGGSSSDNSAQTNDLNQIADDTPRIVSLLDYLGQQVFVVANNSVVGLQDLGNIYSEMLNLDDTLHAIIKSVDSVTTAILYPRAPTSSEQESLANQRLALQSLSNIHGSVNSFQSQSAAANIQTIAQGQAAIAAAQQELAAARTTAEEIQALQDLQAADDALAVLAQQQGNQTLANAYHNDSISVGNQIQALGGPINQVTGAVNGLGNTITTSGNAVSYTVASGASAIVSTVAGSGAAIVGAIGSIATSVSAALAAFASTFSTLLPTGGAGTSTYYGGGKPASAPPDAKPTGETYKGPPPAPPGTGATSTPPGTYGPPIGSYSGYPGFQTGGMMMADGLAKLEAGEFVIPPPPATITLPDDVLARIDNPVGPPTPSLTELPATGSGGASGAAAAQSVIDGLTAAIAAAMAGFSSQTADALSRAITAGNAELQQLLAAGDAIDAARLQDVISQATAALAHSSASVSTAASVGSASAASLQTAVDALQAALAAFDQNPTDAEKVALQDAIRQATVEAAQAQSSGQQAMAAQIQVAIEQAQKALASSITSASSASASSIASEVQATIQALTVAATQFKGSPTDADRSALQQAITAATAEMAKAQESGSTALVSQLQQAILAAQAAMAGVSTSAASAAASAGKAADTLAADSAAYLKMQGDYMAAQQQLITSLQHGGGAPGLGDKSLAEMYAAVTANSQNMNSVPSFGGAVASPATNGGGAGTQVNNFYVTSNDPRTVVQQISDYMKRQSPKMAVLSS